MQTTTSHRIIALAFAPIALLATVIPAVSQQTPPPGSFPTAAKPGECWVQVEGPAKPEDRWRQTLCDMTQDEITLVQAALCDAGHDPGQPNGKVGPKTDTAVKTFQLEKGLPTGPLTLETLKALGLEKKLRSPEGSG